MVEYHLDAHLAGVALQHVLLLYAFAVRLTFSMNSRTVHNNSLTKLSLRDGRFIVCAVQVARGSHHLRGDELHMAGSLAIRARTTIFRGRKCAMETLRRTQLRGRTGEEGSCSEGRSI